MVGQFLILAVEGLHGGVLFLEQGQLPLGALVAPPGAKVETRQQKHSGDHQSAAGGEQKGGAADGPRHLVEVFGNAYGEDAVVSCGGDHRHAGGVALRLIEAGSLLALPLALEQKAQARLPGETVRRQLHTYLLTGLVEQDLAARVQKEDLIPGRGGEAAGHLPVKEREVHQRGVPQPPLPLQLEGEIDGAVLRHAGADTVPLVQAAPDGKRIAGASRGGEQHPPVLETEKVGDKGLTDKRVVLEQLKELLRLPGEAVGLRIGKVLQPDEVVQLPDKLLQGARNAAVHRTGQSVELAVRLLQQEGVVAAEALHGQGQAANGEEKNQDHQKKNRRPALFLPLHTTHPLVKFRQILYTEIILDFKPAVKGEKHSGGYGADCGRR